MLENTVNPRHNYDNSNELQVYISNRTIDKVKQFFCDNPDQYKYSRKCQTTTSHSFRKVGDQIYLQCRGRIGQGDYGYIKRVINIDDQKEYALKVMGMNQNRLSDWESNQSLLEKHFKEEYYGFFKVDKSTSISMNLNEKNDDKANISPLHHSTSSSYCLSSINTSPSEMLNNSDASPCSSAKYDSIPPIKGINLSEMLLSPPSPSLLSRTIDHNSMPETPKRPTKSNRKNRNHVNPMSLFLPLTPNLQAIDFDNSCMPAIEPLFLNEVDYANQPLEPKKNYWYKKNQDPKAFPKKYEFKVGFVMKLFKNTQSLKNFLKSNLDLDFVFHLQLLLTVFKKLQKMHDKNVIHNDLNLGNILINYDEKEHNINVEFIDYDFAKVLPNNQEVIGLMNGQDKNQSSDEVVACAPEQFKRNIFTEDSFFKDEFINHPLLKDKDAIKKILNSENKGFSSRYSDIYILGKAFKYHHSNIESKNSDEQQAFLQGLFANMMQENPLARDPLEKLIAKCEIKLQEEISQDTRKANTLCSL